MTDRDSGPELPAPPRILNEAERCAGLLLEKGLLPETPGFGCMPPDRTADAARPGDGRGGTRGPLTWPPNWRGAAHRSLVMSAGGALTAELGAGGSRHYDWPIGKKSPSTLLLAFRLRRFLREEKVDVLHARSRLPAWVSYLAWKNMPAAERPLFVTTVHGPYRVGRYSAVMTRGQRVIAVSRYIYEYILANYPGTDPGKLAIIPRGVDPRRFPRGHNPAGDWLERWRSEQPQLQEKKLVTLPGRITRWKGHEDFIGIVGGLKQSGVNVHGLVAGGAEPRRRGFLKELKRLTARRGLEHDITFLGARTDLREVMCVSDVVLSLANVPEAFGRTALEALSLGRPVVAYNHGGAGEVLGELQPEGLVEPGDIASAAEKIRAFLDTTPAIAANRTFTLERMLDLTLALYERA